jgi:hypothetical protein
MLIFATQDVVACDGWDGCDDELRNRGHDWLRPLQWLRYLIEAGQYKKGQL